MSLLKQITSAGLALACMTTYASPAKLITHNRTNVESNAYIAEVIPSVHPTKANSDGIVSWAEVRIACFGHTVNNKCSALIKMETNTSHPVDIGVATLDLDTGYITFKYTNESASSYVVTVNGPAEVTLSQK